MKKLLLFVVLFCAAISCAEVDINESTEVTENSDQTQVTVTVLANSEADTRVSVDEQWSVTWDEGESVAAWSATNYSYSEFAMTGDYDPNVATFTGFISGYQYRLISPYRPEDWSSYPYYEADITTQVAGLNSTYMVSGDLIDATDSSIIPEMKHAGAAAALNIKYTNLGDKEYFLTSVEVSDVPVLVCLFMNKSVDDPDFMMSDEWSDYDITTIEIEEPIAVSEGDAEVRFNIFPFTLAAGKGLDITLNFKDEDGAKYSYATSISNNTDADIDFKRATYNTINCTCDIENIAGGESFNLNKFSATNYPSGTTWVIPDSSASSSDFNGLKQALNYNGFGAGTISLEFPNLKELPGNALYSIDAIKSVSLPVATSIGYAAFLFCGYMTDVYMPNVTSIAQEALCVCSSLNNVVISEDVEYIGGGAFSACANLTNLTLNSPLFAFEDGIIYGLSDSGDKISLICALMAVVSGDLYSDTVLSIESWALEYCNITSIDMPAVTTLQSYALSTCAATTINFPSVQIIDDYALYFSGYPESDTERTITLATDESAELSYVGSYVFDTSKYIDLILGVQNGKYASGNTFIAGQDSYEFKSITTPEGYVFTPLITLSGEAAYTTSLGEMYIDPGEYTATDNDGTDITANVTIDTSGLDVTTAGIYTITYSVDSVYGYTSTATRTVIVCYLDSETPNISGLYTVQDGSYRTYWGNNAVFSGQSVVILQTGPGLFYVSDFFGGYYDQFAGYGSSYAMTGYTTIGGDNSFALQSSYLVGWGDSLNSLNNGAYDPETGKIYWEATYVGSEMIFYVTLAK